MDRGEIHRGFSIPAHASCNLCKCLTKKAFYFKFFGKNSTL
jgi:hypothetical protein